jgi:hypothetical protein
MKSPVKLLTASVIGLVLMAFTASGQEKYQLQFRGSCTSTNESGDLLKEKITHKTLIQECIADLGLTNKPKLALVYHVNADFNGDIIEVSDSQTGDFLCQKMRLLFPITMESGDGSEMHQLIEVFAPGGNDPVGHGFVTKRISSNGKVKISGNLTFSLPAEGSRPLRICTATFNSSKLITTGD